MRLLINKKWASGFLDQTMFDCSVRIAVTEWYNLKKITDIYFIPLKHWRVVLNYFREIGLRFILRKIISRFLETGRNDKFLSCGTGIVVDTQSESFQMGTPVFFIAPCDARCTDRVVLHEVFVFPVRPEDLCQRESGICYRNLCEEVKISEKLSALSGWNSFSGQAIFNQDSNILLEEIKTIIFDARNQKEKFFFDVMPSSPCERSQAQVKKNSDKLNGVVFGYGQYAKTEILPNVSRYIKITCIHEIDPAQIGRRIPGNIVFDTSASFRPFEHYNICFIAGYHHTHALLAIHALQNNMAVVVEKPLVTTGADLDALIAALKGSNTAYYAAFQKRYSIFNDYIYQDLCCNLGEAISYSCIVFEVSLPRLHWYNWPNSKNRLLSNGCHWIDHFLFLNNFSNLAHHFIYLANNGDIHVILELENKAVFSMHLTEVGSHRIGLQEYVELRAKNSTVKIVNASEYVAENTHQILRKKKINKLSTYHRMYEKIAKDYYGHHRKNKVSARVGDSIESVHISSAVVLKLADELADLMKQREFL